MALAAALVVVVAAAIGLVTPKATPEPSPGIASPVEGVVVGVDAAGLGRVSGFTLRPINMPFEFGFALGALENPTEFSPSHLAEHLATSEPVRVFFRLENGGRVVYRLEDATPGPSSTP